MKRIIFICFLFYAARSFSQQPPATVKEYNEDFITYPFSDPNPIPLLNPVYPYFRFDGFTSSPVHKSWKVIELENPYIRLKILPEIGGKIWAAIEKSTNRPFLYYNHVVKFRDIAMRGPWTSGGLEANFGIIGHTPNCSTPVDYIISKNPDGSVTCTIGALDLLSRSYWRMEINLPKDKAYFTTKSFWYNATPLEQPYYHWMNAGLPAKGGLEFIYPGTRYLGHQGEFSDWPVNMTNGKQISFYENNNFGGYKSYHVFGRYSDFAGAYWHQDDYGMVRYGSHEGKPGKKIWIWGLSGQGMIWEKLLTDRDGQYVELQSGRRFNQNAEASSLTPFKQTAFAPYGTDTWVEYWYPVIHTKGMVMANQYGALNLKCENGWLKVYFSPAQALREKLVIKEGERTIYSKDLDLETLKYFSDSVKVQAVFTQLVARLGENKMIFQANPSSDTLARPVATPDDFNWKGAYGLYLLGRDAMEGKNYPLAEEKLLESLEKDHNFLPALVTISELMYRNMRFKEALEYSKHALSIDTYDGGANYFYGLINEQLGDVANAKDGFDIASLGVSYRSPAFTELSKIYFRQKNFDRANSLLQQAIDCNGINMEALQVRALLYRYLHDERSARQQLDLIRSLDPLNHFVGMEKYFWQPTEANEKEFLALIRNELPQETILELGIWYFNIGGRIEAEKLFSLIPDIPEAAYWLSYLRNVPLDFAKIHPDLSFPFRSETGLVIQELAKKQNHWLLKYHLALIYNDRNRTNECKDLLKACGNEPSFAPFYAVRAAINKGDANSARADLYRALSLDNQWRYYKLIAEYFINHQQYDSALYYAGTFYLSHPSQYIMGMLYARTLLLNKKYREADRVLNKLQIIPFEGAIDGRELYRETKLMQAAQLISEKKYQQGVQFIDQARQWPENLGVGKPYEEDMDLRLEDWMEYLCLIKQNRVQSAREVLDRIVRFNPHIENTVRNFNSANTLVTAWAFQKLNQSDKAADFLNEAIKKFPEDKIIRWSKSVWEGSDNSQMPSSEKSANVRIIEGLLQIP